MLLSELLKGVNVKSEYIDREISDVTDNNISDELYTAM